MKKKIIIIGKNGFIGFNLTKLLKKNLMLNYMIIENF